MICLLLLVGCKDDNSCGDGVCEGIENKNCPQDCVSSDGVLYLGFMLHLEGWDREPEDEDYFRDHAAAARTMADVFEERGAKVTFEARPEFVQGCVNWDDNVLKELYERGHGIGVHADVGGNPNEGLTQEEFVNTIASLKVGMEDLLGYEVRHVSGTCSDLDWVNAGIDAGYEFTTGNVAYCVMSMPYENRPDEFKECITPRECHDAFPVDLKDRLHPWRMSSGENWVEHDEDGELVILPAGNLIKGFGPRTPEEIELKMGPKSNLQSSGSYLDEGDIDVFIESLGEAVALSEEGKTNIYYVAWSIGHPLIDEEAFDYFFEQIQPFIDSGQVEWKTLPEMYDAYVNE